MLISTLLLTHRPNSITTVNADNNKKHKLETFCYITISLKFIGIKKIKFWEKGSRVKTVKPIDEIFRQVVPSDDVKGQRNLLLYCGSTKCWCGHISQIANQTPTRQNIAHHPPTKHIHHIKKSANYTKIT